MDIFSVKDISVTTWLMILKFGTKLDSDELYCVTKKKTATYCLSVPLFVHFFLSPMEISVTDFSAPIGGQCSQILCTLSGRQNVLCKWNLSC